MSKSIGIWGFGIVGKSAVTYFHKRGVRLEVLDKRSLTQEEQTFLQERNIPFFGPQELTHFLERNDAILPSPGIDLRPYSQYRHKWIAELDLFARSYKHPIIAVTGTIGKTSVTHLLSALLQAHGIQLATGGNIGTAMLDLLEQPSTMALLEVSSFQLELSQTFAPDLALWTNCYPNHLDRHSNYAEYVDAKYKIISLQREDQQALLPFSLIDEVEKRGWPRSSLAFFSVDKPLNHYLYYDCTFYYYGDNHLVVQKQDNIQQLIATADLPTISFLDNWLIICGALHMLNIPMSIIQRTASAIALPEHRLEKIGTHNGIDFYNDSKSTTPISTQAALSSLQGKPVHLFLGGLGKGVDRSPLIQELKKHTIVHVYCFGKEAENLHALCTAAQIASSAHATLEDAFDLCIRQAQAGQRIVFSPSGSSYDLFENYMERGNRFKELVEGFAESYKKETSESTISPDFKNSINRSW